GVRRLRRGEDPSLRGAGRAGRLLRRRLFSLQGPVRLHGGRGPGRGEAGGEGGARVPPEPASRARGVRASPAAIRCTRPGIALAAPVRTGPRPLPTLGRASGYQISNAPLAPGSCGPTSTVGAAPGRETQEIRNKEAGCSRASRVDAGE